ncbi:MAG: hypothetical protein AMXMBFR64_03880 [Myxococcales bacterium]
MVWALVLVAGCSTSAQGPGDGLTEDGGSDTLAGGVDALADVSWGLPDLGGAADSVSTDSGGGAPDTGGTDAAAEDAVALVDAGDAATDTGWCCPDDARDVLWIDDGTDADGDPMDADGGADGDQDGGADGGPPADVPWVPPVGSWDNPIPATTWPFVHSGDTTLAPSALVSSYGCAPAIDESGGEVVYALQILQPSRLTVTVSDLPGDDVDVDVHVLANADPSSCIARADKSLVATVPAGEVLVVVDTWAGDGVSHPGPYTLVVKLEGGTGSADCTKNPMECPAKPPAPPSLPPEPPGVGDCPAGMTKVDTFCIDRWEAALVDVATGAPWSPYVNPGGASLRAVSVPGATPQAYINQLQAGAACAMAGKRLCTDQEWLRACQGPAKTLWPYGPVTWPGFCNDARMCHPAVQTFQTTASWIWSSLGDPCIAQLPWGLAATGAYSACVTAEGAYDMAGNLHEWTDDPAGTFRGGFYVDTAINGTGCTYKTTAHDVSHWDYSTGFRCCFGP